MLRFLINAEKRAVDTLHFRQIRSLPFLKRLCHRRTLRHLFAVTLGLAIALSGSWLAVHRESALALLPPFAGDCIAYTIHAIGAVPIVGNFEPLWKILIAAE